MAIVDTSFLIALQDEDDHFHRRAKETPLIGDRFLVPWEIWIECCQTLMRMVPGRQAAAAVSSVLHGPFHVDKVLSAEEIAAMYREIDAENQTRSGGRNRRRPSPAAHPSTGLSGFCLALIQFYCYIPPAF